MAPSQKRKLDSNGTETPVMSAFAARQRLWESAAGSGLQPQPSSVSNSPQRSSLSLQTGLELSPRLDEEPNLKPASPVRQSLSKPRTISQHSTFRPDRKNNYQTKVDGRALLRLTEGERLVILGSFGIKVCEGELTIAGAVLRSSAPIQWVHASHCHALPVVRSATDVVVELLPHPAAPGLRQLAGLNPVFAKLWHECAPGSSTFQIIYTAEDGPKKIPLQELSSPAEWNKKLAGIIKSKNGGDNPIIFLCGPKSSGKSTFGRLLANRLVTDQGHAKNKPWSPIAILDLDPGQPEYSPPGIISLVRVQAPNLAPSFCHPASPSQIRSHAIAATTPAQDPSHFVACALDLLSHHHTVLPNTPLIVNTPGWIQGTGLDILVSLIKGTHPTEVIYMSFDGPDESVEALESATRAKTTVFTTLPSQASAGASRTSLELRTMQTMAYFHLASLDEEPPTWETTPLNAIRPWRVRYSGADRGFFGVLCYDHQPGPDLLGEAINGMVLGLVRVESLEAWKEFGLDEMAVDGDATEGVMVDTREGIPMVRNPFGRTLDPRYTRALGLVLVRGIDTGRKELQIVTPINGDLLCEGGKDLVLIAGKFDTPNWAYAEELYAKQWGGIKVTAGSEEEDDEEVSNPGAAGFVTTNEVVAVPWVEIIHGSKKRSIGSRVWRVRRDLGRS